MSRLTRKIALCALLTLCFFLCGCGQRQEAETPPVTLTALQYELENQNTDFANMWFFHQIEQDTGIHVEFEEVKDQDWTTRLSLMFASNNFRDMILRGSLDTEEYGATQHLLVPLEDYLEDYMPNYFSRLGMDGGRGRYPLF